MSHIVSQFGRPHGAGGQLAGWVMANRPSNRQRNWWTVDLLRLEPTHRVLELGFGPGLALERVAETVTEGTIVGVDHSETMLRQAAERNRAALDSGRLRLIVDRAEQLPADLGRFNRIYSVNVVQFWKVPQQVFADMVRHLEPGGVIATTYQPRHRGATPDDAGRKADRIAEWMSASGFEDIRFEWLELHPVPAVSVIGTSPG